MKLITKIFVAVDIIIAFCFLMVYGPIDKARVFWITTSMNTMNHKYLAHIFYSEKQIDKVLSENYFLEVNEETNASDINIGLSKNTGNYSSVYEKQILDRNEDDLYKLIEFKYGDFDCYLVAIYDPKRVHAVPASKKLNSGRILSDITKENDAILGINGGGYSWANGYPQGWVISYGETLYSSNTSSYVTAGIDKDGILNIGTFTQEDIKNKNIVEALSFTPALIVNGNPIKIKGNGGSGQNPRTVIAQRKDGIMLFLVVNGYTQAFKYKGRGGVYYSDLIKILERYGAYNALNLDGGSSTTIVINNKLINSPVEPQKEGQDFIRTAFILK